MSKRAKTHWPGEHICQNVQKLIGQETQVLKRTISHWSGEPKCQNVQKLIGKENTCVKTYKN